jgi:hypothetical protein
MTPIAKYQRAFALGMQQALEYRVNFLLHLTAAFFQIFIHCSSGPLSIEAPGAGRCSGTPTSR